MNPQLNIKSFTINKDENTFCKNFIHDIGGESQLGIFVEIKNSPKKTKQSKESADLESLGEFISSNIKSEFCNNPEKSAFIRFENTLAKAESVLSAVSENKSALLNKITLLIIAVKNNELYFSKHGKMYACLFKDDSIINISPKSKKTSNPIKTNFKIFPYIINAKIRDNEKIIFLNETSGNYCDRFQLEALLKSNSAEKFEEFKNDLSTCAFSSVANFALLNLENKPKPEIDKPTKQKQEISPREEETASFPEKSKNIETPPVETALLAKTTSKVTELSGKTINMIGAVISRVQPTLQSIKIPKLSFNLARLTRKNKAIMLGGGIIASILIFQVYTTIASKNQFEDLASIIFSKKDEAIFLSSSNQEHEAIQKLIEAKNLTATIFTQLPEYKEKAEQISAGVETELNKIAKITEVKDPEKISELSNFGIKFEPKNIFKSSDYVLVTGAEFGLVYKIDLETKRRGFNFFSTIEDKIYSAVKSSNAMSFFAESGKTYIFYPESQKIVELNLSKNENQIVGLSEKTIDLYDGATSEIKILSQNNLSTVEKITAQSPIAALASDNKSIFTLTVDNRLIKITGSKQEQIANINSLPLFEKAPSIYTNDNSSNIYLANKKQVAIYSKDGEFIGQYNIEGINDIIDIIISDDKELFLLSTDGVYKINLQ